MLCTLVDIMSYDSLGFWLFFLYFKFMIFKRWKRILSILQIALERKLVHTREKL